MVVEAKQNKVEASWLFGRGHRDNSMARESFRQQLWELRICVRRIWEAGSGWRFMGCITAERRGDREHGSAEKRGEEDFLFQ